MAKLNPIELQKALKGVDYPAKKSDLVKAAETNGASEEIRSALDNLPDQSFETPADVNEDIGFGEDKAKQ